MAYLLDTNIWLERLLDQDRAKEVGRFLDAIPGDELGITDFSLHSIGVTLGRLKRTDLLISFVRDVSADGGASLVRLLPEDTAEVVAVMGRFSLDFDDAYQYVAAARHHMTLVSFDSDFDRTDVGRKTPADVLKTI